MKTASRHGVTVTGYSPGAKIGMYAGFGAAGLAVGYMLPRIADWALRLPWFPFEDTARLIHSLDGPYLKWILAFLGLLAGFVLAFIAVWESLKAAISNHEVSLEQGENRRTIPRRDIASVFLDGKELVILGTSGHELVRMPGVEHPEDLAEAFQNHGYPWSADGDPFKDRYRRWVPDLPELPPSAHALLKVRERALKEKNKKDIAELREELAKIGYIVRDEGVNQYWRPVEKPPVSKK
jgi:hypothetical protein